MMEALATSTIYARFAPTRLTAAHAHPVCHALVKAVLMAVSRTFSTFESRYAFHPLRMRTQPRV